jgi:hypothetical protein
MKSKERGFKARKMELERSWSFTIDPKRTQKSKTKGHTSFLLDFLTHCSPNPARCETIIVA